MNLLRLILVLLAIAPLSAAFAQADGNLDLQRLSSVPDPQARIEQLENSSMELFHQAVHEYDVAVEEIPYDIMAQLARCEFMSNFANANEYAPFVDDVYEQAQACNDAVAEKFPDHPEIQLRNLERLSLAERLKTGEAVLARSAVQNWTSGQLARLNVLLANAAESKNGQRSIVFARQALVYDQRADVRELLARKLLAAGKKSEAIEVLTLAGDPHGADETWYHAEKMKMLAQAGASRDSVLSIYKGLQDQDGYNHLAAARALMHAGAIDEARREFDQMAKDGVTLSDALWERFRFEFANGSAPAALTAYNRWRDDGWAKDPLAVNRVALLSKDAGLPWKARDLLGLGGLLLAIAAVASFMLVPISMIHYRGLARRAHTMDPYPRTGWQLRHAWLAMSLFAIAQIFGMYGAGPFDLRELAQGAPDELGIDQRQLAQIALVSDLLAIAFLLPLGGMARRIWTRWSVRYWSIGRALLTGCIVGAAFRAPLLFTAFSAGVGPTGNEPVQDALWTILRGMRDEFGILTAFWFVAVSAPVIEEFIFRGVMLNALASHLRFRWANVIQALLFSAMHMDAKAAVPLFVFGLVAAGLTKRSGGLLASMTMHAMFNLIGAWVMLVWK